MNNDGKTTAKEDILVIKTAQAFNMPEKIADPLYACGKILKEMEVDYTNYKIDQWHQIESLAKLIDEILIYLEINGLRDEDKYIIDNILETSLFLSEDLIFSAVLSGPTDRLKKWMDEENKVRKNSGEVKIYVYNKQKVNQ